MACHPLYATAVTVISYLDEAKWGGHGLIAIPCIVGHVSQLFIDAAIASRWAANPPAAAEEEEEATAMAASSSSSSVDARAGGEGKGVEMSTSARAGEPSWSGASIEEVGSAGTRK